MPRGVHGEKIVAAIESDKMPATDVPRLREALIKYDEWNKNLKDATGDTLDELVAKMVVILNEYKLYVDVDLIFDSTEDFLYRQKGQLKLDNTVIEEFMPIFVRKCIEYECGTCDVEVGSQIPTFSSVYFESGLSVRRQITIGHNSKLNFRLTSIRPRGLTGNCTFLSA